MFVQLLSKSHCRRWVRKNLAKQPANLPKAEVLLAFLRRYEKTSRTCAEPDHIATCPLPTHRLRNGHLNQIGYSLYLFIRDVAEGDLVGWIDDRLGVSDPLAQARMAYDQREAPSYGARYCSSLGSSRTAAEGPCKATRPRSST